MKARLTWARQVGASQIGASENDIFRAVAVDDEGAVYVAGQTSGRLADAPSPDDDPHDSDAVLARYDRFGNQTWIRQLGSVGAHSDSSFGVAVDASRNVFVTGRTLGRMAPGLPSAKTDVFLARFDRDGELTWTRQLGSLADDFANCIATDSHGNVFVAGSTKGHLAGGAALDEDAFVACWDAAGERRWVRQWRRLGVQAFHGIAVGAAGDVYVGGVTRPGVPAPSPGDQIFLARLDRDGNDIGDPVMLGTTADDAVLALAADPHGYVYAVGRTAGRLGTDPHAGAKDSFVVKLDRDLDTIWMRQLGTELDDYALAVQTDRAGNAYVAGMVQVPREHGPAYDIAVAAYDRDGNQRWRHQIGSSVVPVPSPISAASDWAFGIAIDPVGRIFVAGLTTGKLAERTPVEGAVIQGNDAIVALIEEEPETIAESWELHKRYLDAP